MHRHFIPLVVATIVALACITGREYLPFVDLAENWVADLRVARLTPLRPQNKRIAVVTITEDTLTAFPYRSPVDRKFLSDLLRTLELKGARAIGIDILFDQPTEPAKDALLRRTLRELKIPVVVGRVDDGVGLSKSQLVYINEYLDGVETGLALLAKDNVDGKVRLNFLGKRIDGKWVPGFMVALARMVGATIPEGGEIPLAYHGNPNANPPPFPTYPAHVAALMPNEWFAGKIVLIGGDLSLEDRHLTPFDDRYELGRGMPGVMIHAHSLAQILENRKPPVFADWQGVLIVLLLSFTGLILASTNLVLVIRAAIVGATVIVFWIGGFVLYQHGGSNVPLVTPTIALALSAGSQMALRWQGERTQKLFIRDAFSKYLAPSMVAQLVADPDALALTGRKRTVTSLFTDIANFTSLMEHADPSVMVPVLNRYLDQACKIVHDHGGTIDKIVGDALVVFFNAPLDQPDHADLAVACALDLDRFSEAYRTRVAGDGIVLGCTRIGLNTGLAVVGNFGGYERFAYTAYGDAINTAARLEGANKYFGTRVCVSGGTVALTTRFHFRPIGNVVLKGKSEPVETFEPISDAESSSPKTVAYLEAYGRLQRTGDGALDAFESLAGRHPEDALIQFHARRLTSLAHNGLEDVPMFSNQIVLGDK